MRSFVFPFSLVLFFLAGGLGASQILSVLFLDPSKHNLWLNVPNDLHTHAHAHSPTHNPPPHFYHHCHTFLITHTLHDTHTHAHAHTRSHACTHTRSHLASTHAHAHTHTSTHARAHTRTHARAHARTHVRTHAHPHLKKTELILCLFTNAWRCTHSTYHPSEHKASDISDLQKQDMVFHIKDSVKWSYSKHV